MWEKRYHRRSANFLLRILQINRSTSLVAISALECVKIKKEKIINLLVPQEEEAECEFLIFFFCFSLRKQMWEEEKCVCERISWRLNNCEISPKSQLKERRRLSRSERCKFCCVFIHPHSRSLISRILGRNSIFSRSVLFLSSLP